jgi:hypothetical protein
VQSIGQKRNSLMIHVRCQRTNSGDTAPESIQVLHISLTSQEDIKYFRKLIALAMNINYPEVPKDWRDLADQIEFGRVFPTI